jgi:hypothetical protein
MEQDGWHKVVPRRGRDGVRTIVVPCNRVRFAEPEPEASTSGWPRDCCPEGSLCQRLKSQRGCDYQHPFVHRQHNPRYPAHLCRFGSKCNSDSCSYVHPGDVPTASADECGAQSLDDDDETSGDEAEVDVGLPADAVIERGVDADDDADDDDEDEEDELAVSCRDAQLLAAICMPDSHYHFQDINPVDENAHYATIMRESFKLAMRSGQQISVPQDEVNIIIPTTLFHRAGSSSFIGFRVFFSESDQMYHLADVRPFCVLLVPLRTTGEASHAVLHFMQSQDHSNVYTVNALPLACPDGSILCRFGSDIARLRFDAGDRMCTVVDARMARHQALAEVRTMGPLPLCWLLETKHD